MKNLLKADLSRILKSKLFMISMILAVAFPLLTGALYFGIEKLAMLGIAELEEMEGMEGFDVFSSSTLLVSAFSPSNNIGLLIPIFSTIFIGQDISNGTLRNKVIIGNSRTNVYFSHLISSMLFNAVTVSVYFAFTVLFSGLFMGFDKFNALSFLYFVITGELTFVFVACLSTMLILATKNTAVSIILTEVIVIVLSFATAVLGIVSDKSYRYILFLVPTYSNSAGLLTYAEPPTAMFSEGVASYIFFGALLTVWGICLFKKKDIK